MSSSSVDMLESKDGSAQEAAAQRLLQLGIALFLLGLITGLAVPSLANPRMALASQIEGVMNGTFLLVLFGLRMPRAPRNQGDSDA